MSIATLTGDNGILGKASLATLKTEIAQVEEELELFKTEKTSENIEFIADTLNADKGKISYNTKVSNKENNINDILPSLKNWKYKDNIEVSKGVLTFVSQDWKLIELAKSLELNINPYEIVDGELQSSETNLALMDSTGTLTLPSSVTKIGEGAFSDVEGLKTIIIPGTCKVIGKNAFSNNKTLEKVIMQEGIEEIENHAFMQCTNLHTVKMADTIMNIGGSAFASNIKLQNINIPKQLKTLKSFIFNSCGFKEIIIPNNIVSIESHAFGTCRQLQRVVIPESVQEISEGTFSACNNLKNIEIHSNNENFIFENGILLDIKNKKMILVLDSAISNNIFTVPEGVVSLSNQISIYPQITTINIPQSVTLISPNSIGKNITQVNIASENEKYETYQNAIYEKNNKIREKLIRYYGTETNVKIEEGIKEIGDSAFKEKQITNISLPNSLEKIGNSSLGVSSLTSLSLGDKVKSIHPLFIYNSNITSLKISENNPNYIVENNILYNKDITGETKELIVPIYPIGTIETFEIPYGVTKIGNLAFHNQHKMKNIKIPETVTEIESSFNNCHSLIKIEIPHSVIKINSTCFANSPNISEVIINKEKGSIPGSPWGISKGERAIKWLK